MRHEKCIHIFGVQHTRVRRQVHDGSVCLMVTGMKFDVFVDDLLVASGGLDVDIKQVVVLTLQDAMSRFKDDPPSEPLVRNVRIQWHVAAKENDTHAYMELHKADVELRKMSVEMMNDFMLSGVDFVYRVPPRTFEWDAEPPELPRSALGWLALRTSDRMVVCMELNNEYTLQFKIDGLYANERGKLANANANAENGCVIIDAPTLTTIEARKFLFNFALHVMPPLDVGCVDMFAKFDVLVESIGLKQA